MTSRERVKRAMHFDLPDMMPLECSCSPGGLHEHGEKLRDLWRRYPSDFGDISETPITHPAPQERDADGRYHTLRVDEWGIEWEHTIYGAWGIPRRRPLDDLANLPKFAAPPGPPMSGPAFERARAVAARHRERYYLWGGGGDLFETLRSVRRYEDVLIDILEDTPEINAIADIITSLREQEVAHALALDVDGVAFGDDHGTQNALIVSLPVWRRFFKPRYERLFAPARAAGKDIHFHSCGQIAPLLPELAELGVTSVWPQLPLYDAHDLARTCRELDLAVALHVDRSHLMTFGTPDQVWRSVAEVADAFGRPDGGAWWYVEIDVGFPWENVEALFAAIDRHRRFPRAVF